jgi:hypothetical protein
MTFDTAIRFIFRREEVFVREFGTVHASVHRGVVENSKNVWNRDTLRTGKAVPAACTRYLFEAFIK